jgi:hypothetical protein
LNQTYQLQNEVSGVTPGMVTIEDYNAWKSRFGMAGGGAAGVLGGGSGVPEPGTFAYLVAAGVAGLAGFRRGKGSANGYLQESS